MVEDKYIGLALAVSGTLAIGASSIITKKGLNDAAKKSSYGKAASEDMSYFKNPIWWAGMSVLVLGEFANFAAYTFAPAILVTPLGALSVIFGAALASFLLNETLGHLGRLGCTLCLLGSLIIVLHAPSDKEGIDSVEVFLSYVLQPGFLLFSFTALVFSLIMIFLVAPKYGRANPAVYVSICSVAGSVSIMAIKGFGLALKLTLAGNNQFTHLVTYVFGATMVGCIIVQMNYYNKALDMFPTNLVNPIYYVFFSTATIVASLILFQGFNTSDAAGAVSLLAGLVVTFLGVHLLNFSRIPESQIDCDHAPPHSALESGLMNPRLSLQGGSSIDGWAGIGVSPGGPRSGHGRQTRASTLFGSIDENEAGGDRVGLRNLREEEETEEDDDDDDLALKYDERTRLTAKSMGTGHPSLKGPAGHRDQSRSAVPGSASVTDLRTVSR
ncbi:magnesium transporter NIPA-domain-containing protein [Ephemerocybe angulata]|uniref:Magnesium transporter NIPA-domain-containing protein n=1 Tax=Ephemerocybe angulata TaxID=980116 RepID=A0A8H6HUK6_9AGAR|nr:magnesium transporter NIPA-domain-containing protein [Tulosesus angulatus]